MEADPGPLFDIYSSEGVGEFIEVIKFLIVLETALVENLGVSILDCPDTFLEVNGFVGYRAHHALVLAI